MDSTPSVCRGLCTWECEHDLELDEQITGPGKEGEQEPEAQVQQNRSAMQLSPLPEPQAEGMGGSTTRPIWGILGESKRTNLLCD
jgi:hypothetical protein